MEPLFFKSPQEWRQWLEQNHAGAAELWVGFYKKDSGRPSITWPEAVDEALCYGWIDGLRKGLDQASYMIRFTPRKPASTWSTVNINRVEALIGLGRMQPDGLQAFQVRTLARSSIYSYEQEGRGLADEYTARFRENEKAWAFFQSQPPGYQRTASYWVMSAQREETRLKRLAILVGDSQNGRIIAPLQRRPKAK